MKKKWQKYIVLYILNINPPFSCSQNPLLRLELLNDPERWEKQKRKQTNKQTNSQKKKNNNNKKKEELMLAVLSLFLAVVMDGRGILQISFNLIMASLGSRQTVFSSSFVFIFFFSYLKTKEKKKKRKGEIDDFHRPEQFYTFTYRLNNFFHRHWSLIEHTYHNRKKKGIQKGVQPSIPGSSCRDRVGYTLVELITNTHTYQRCTLHLVLVQI